MLPGDGLAQAARPSTAPQAHRTSVGRRPSLLPPARSRSFRTPNHRAASLRPVHPQRDQALSISPRRESRSHQHVPDRSHLLGCWPGPNRQEAVPHLTGVGPDRRPPAACGFGASSASCVRRAGAPLRRGELHGIVSRSRCGNRTTRSHSGTATRRTFFGARGERWRRGGRGPGEARPPQPSYSRRPPSPATTAGGPRPEVTGIGPRS